MDELRNTVDQVDVAFIYIVGFSLVFLIFITALMIYFAVRYRRSKNPRPSDIRGDWRLELAWTAIPTAIAMSMFWLGWQSYQGLRDVPEDAMEVQVIAQQYSWIFIYPNDKATENEMVVPLGRAVKLNLSSEDVLHSFFVPAFRVKMDTVPGMETYTWFRADQLGQYEILCAELCGVGHADMTGILKIVPEAEYEAWLQED
jgi:cytochrome c oxidase subunit 2